MERPLFKLHDQVVTDNANSAMSNGDSMARQADSQLADVNSMGDEMRPVKKQKQGDPSASSLSKNAHESPFSVPTSNDVIDDDSIVIHPSIAEIIKLEDIPSVEPLEYLTLRETAGELFPLLLILLFV